MLLLFLIPILWLNFWYSRVWVRGVLVLLIVVDLFMFRGFFNQMTISRNMMINSLESNPVVLVAQSLPKDARFQVRDAYPLYANFGLIHRVSNTNGYNPFKLAHYFRIEPFSPEGAFLLGARLIDSADFEQYVTKWKKQEFFQIYQGFMVNHHVLPRVFLVTEGRYDPNINIGARLEEKSFDPLETVYLESEFQEMMKKTSQNLSYQISNWKYDTNRIQLDLNSNNPGFLVLTDVFYPGWTATVNDENREVMKANSVIRAVRVNELPAHIIFRFRPRSFALGVIISAVTVLVGIALILGFQLKNRRHRES